MGAPDPLITYSDPVVQAESLLMSVLPREAYLRLCATGSIEVQGKRNKYVLYRTQNTHVIMPDGNTFDACIVFADTDVKPTPRQDKLVMEYFLIRSDEERYLKTANLTPLHRFTQARRDGATERAYRDRVLGYGAVFPGPLAPPPDREQWTERERAERQAVAPPRHIVRRDPPHELPLCRDEDMFGHGVDAVRYAIRRTGLTPQIIVQQALQFISARLTARGVRTYLEHAPHVPAGSVLSASFTLMDDALNMTLDDFCARHLFTPCLELVHELLRLPQPFYVYELAIPAGRETLVRITSEESGLSLRLTCGLAIQFDRMIYRLDIGIC